MKFFTLSLFSLALLTACSQSDTKKDQTTDTITVQDIEVDQFKSAIENSRADSSIVILDVRTPEEYEAGHVEGSVNINFLADDFAARVSVLDTSKTYLVYCRSGRRSSGASQTMVNELGFKEVKNLINAGYPDLEDSE